MQFLLTLVICILFLFTPGGDYLVVPAIGVSIWIGHLRNKHDQQVKRKSRRP